MRERKRERGVMIYTEKAGGGNKREIGDTYRRGMAQSMRERSQQ
jgi:hypothetical protein